jgi:hypothetical protein
MVITMIRGFMVLSVVPILKIFAYTALDATLQSVARLVRDGRETRQVCCGTT